jgi:hypothetical protein
LPEEPAATETRPDYDCVVVGTSPICFITALAEEASGKRVLMADAASEVGGTWKTTKLLGFSNVELGCHEIDAHRGAYALLEALGVPLSVMRPQPILFSDSPGFFPSRLTFRHRWLRDLYDVATGTKNYDLPGVPSSRVQSKVKSVLRVGKYMARSLKGDNYPAKYPPHGANQIVHRLDQLARAAGIEIRCSTVMSDVSLDRAGERVRFRLNGEPATASLLHLTSSSHLAPIRDGDKTIDLGASDNVWQTLYLVLRDCPSVPFTYTVFARPEFLYRASDLSRYAVPEPEREGARLVALTIDETAPENAGTAQKALHQMQSLGLIPATAKLEAFTYLPYPFTRIGEFERRAREQALEPLVKIRESSLLTGSIKFLMQDTDVKPMLRRINDLERAIA